MINIDASVNGAGLLVSCEVTGHAGAGPRGGDVVCAAVSILTRTAFRVLSSTEGVKLRGGSPERGVFKMEADYSGTGLDFLSGAGTFLIEGFSSVAELYPEFCKLNIHRERRN